MKNFSKLSAKISFIFLIIYQILVLWESLSLLERTYFADLRLWGTVRHLCSTSRVRVQEGVRKTIQKTPSSLLRRQRRPACQWRWFIFCRLSALTFLTAQKEKFKVRSLGCSDANPWNNIFCLSSSDRKTVGRLQKQEEADLHSCTSNETRVGIWREREKKQVRVSRKTENVVFLSSV